MFRSFQFPNRRFAAVAILAAGLLSAGQGLAAPAHKIVTVLGDSITAGYGLPAAAALPAQLQAALGKRGAVVTVRGAGVSGDTTADGLARVGFSVQKDSDVCVIALGGNDLLQGVDPATTKANLASIIEKLKARHIRVVLAGLAAPGDIGGAYAREFAAIYPQLAKTYGVTLYPNLLAGVALDGRLNQADGIHPNAQGVLIIAGRLAPVVASALH
jgi:acyl-CoA thioesterase-1